MKKENKYLIAWLLVVSICFSCQQKEGKEKEKDTNSTVEQALNPKKDSVQPPVNPGKDAGIGIKIFKNDSPLSGFGYDIIVKGNTYIHQPNIPAVAGNRGFATEEAARNTAELVSFKIKNNIMPPGVDVKELDSIGALK